MGIPKAITRAAIAETKHDHNLMAVRAHATQLPPAKLAPGANTIRLR